MLHCRVLSTIVAQLRYTSLWLFSFSSSILFTDIDSEFLLLSLREYQVCGCFFVPSHSHSKMLPGQGMSGAVPPSTFMWRFRERDSSNESFFPCSGESFVADGSLFRECSLPQRLCRQLADIRGMSVTAPHPPTFTRLLSKESPGE